MYTRQLVMNTLSLGESSGRKRGNDRGRGGGERERGRERERESESELTERDTREIPFVSICDHEKLPINMQNSEQWCSPTTPVLLYMYFMCMHVGLCVACAHLLNMFVLLAQIGRLSLF